MTGARELRSAIVLCRIRFEVPASELVKLDKAWVFVAR